MCDLCASDVVTFLICSTCLTCLLLFAFNEFDMVGALMYGEMLPSF